MYVRKAGVTKIPYSKSKYIYMQKLVKAKIIIFSKFMEFLKRIRFHIILPINQWHYSYVHLYIFKFIFEALFLPRNITVKHSLRFVLFRPIYYRFMHD